MKTTRHIALLLLIVAGGTLGGGCTSAVRARPIGIADGRQAYSVVCTDNYDLCTAAEDKACPRGHRDLSYSDQVPVVHGHRTWEFEFVCKSPSQ